MRRELSWKWRLPVAIAAMVAMVLISRSMVRGSELPIPKKHRGIVINLTMHREKHTPAPKYVPDDKVRNVVVPIVPPNTVLINRPAGTP